MAWTCYSCGVKNPNSADQCQKCGGTVAAPRSFYIHWIFGGMLFFFIAYLAGVLAGGVLVEAVVSPKDAEVLAEVNAGLTEKTAYKSIETVEPEKTAGAKATLISRAKAEMNPVLQVLLTWMLPVLLFIICGIIVGFVSDGRTVLEAGFASILGQAGGFFLVTYLIDIDMDFLVLAAGVVPGFGLAVLGAWLGEFIQERKERAGGITG